MRRYPLVLTLFLVSGATGLLYEVAFSKLLAYVFGATAYAVSTVLAAFMGGLALGAHFGGKHAARAKRALVVYGVLEIGVGAVCALSPTAVALVTSAYVGIARSAPGSLAAVTLARAALTAIVVVIPTMAMGATLPLLSRVVAGQGAESGRRLASLYAINTLGGALGAVTSAYAILPALGVQGTMRAAAIANVVLGIAAIVAGRSDAPSAALEASPTAPSSSDATTDSREAERLFLLLSFLSGFLVFAAEVVEVHLLALLIGNSAYAFGLMLAVFLVCLSIGAARAPALSRRLGENALPRGLGIAALTIAITLPLWDQLPNLFVLAGGSVKSWLGRELVRAFAALAILVLPTIWMGSTFPLLLERVASKKDVASRVGRLTVANTVGTIVGSITTGYFLLPALGSQNALRFIAVAFAIASLVAARFAAPKAGIQRALAFAAGAIGLAMFLPTWDLGRLTNGANVYFSTRTLPAATTLEFVREDVHGGVTTVTKVHGVRTLWTNGKFQGDDGFEMTAQRRFAHFPSLFVKGDERALVIGLGTGTTLGTILAYPWKHVDAVEISPSIVEASRRFFSGPSRNALEDPRTHLDVNDGRNFLLVRTEPYDLITIELSSVWFAGASNLYSREFYALCRSRLAKGGILQQWVQLHHIRRRELAVIMKSLREEFPHVALFVGGAQGILVASEQPLVASLKRLEALDVRPELRPTLGDKRLEDLFDDLVTSGEDLDRFIAETPGDEGPIRPSTDDNLYLEYATPKGNVMPYKDSLEAALEALNRYRTSDPRKRHLGP